MSIYEFENKKPLIGKGTFIFSLADLIGDVIIGKNCYVGSGACICGNYGSIKIGNDTTIDENVVIHARPNGKTTIGDFITIGHTAIIHNAKIHDWAIIRMAAIVSDYAEIGEWAVSAESAVLKNKEKVPDKSIAVGIPAKVVAEINMDYKKNGLNIKKYILNLPESDFQIFSK
jgi:phenylacetic acid degradation protein